MITREQRYFLADDKIPPEEFLGKWRSIEFELIFKDEDSFEKFEEYCIRSRYKKFITIKDDGSIVDNEGERTRLCKEIVLTYRSGNEAFIKRTLKKLNKYAYVNRSCGTHVHFDMRGFSQTQVKKFGNRLAHCVPALRLILPKSRRDNQYCREIINDLDECYDDRYAFVNMLAYEDHETIEVRGHSGTLNADKILNWIKICETIMSRAKVQKLEYISDIDVFVKHYGFNKRLRTFISERYQKLNQVEPTTQTNN